METKHTPGPWHPGHLGDDATTCECRSIVDEGFAGGVATVHVGNGIGSISEGGNDCPPREQAIANMHLIAAAPELLEALKGLLVPVEDARGDDDVDCMTSAGAYLCGDVMSDAVEKARVVILKATGAL